MLLLIRLLCHLCVPTILKWPQLKTSPWLVRQTEDSFNLFRTAKAATNGNHRLCLKSKPQVKYHWRLTSGINLGRRDASTELSTLDTAHKPSTPLPQARKGLIPGWTVCPLDTPIPTIPANASPHPLQISVYTSPGQVMTKYQISKIDEY